MLSTITWDMVVTALAQLVPVNDALLVVVVVVLKEVLDVLYACTTYDVPLLATVP